MFGFVGGVCVNAGHTWAGLPVQVRLNTRITCGGIAAHLPSSNHWPARHILVFYSDFGKRASQQQFSEGHVLRSSCRDPPVKTAVNVGLHSQPKVLCFLELPFLRETDDPGDVCRDFMWWPGPESSGFCPCYRLGYSSTDWVVSHWHHTGRADGPEGYYQGRSISTPPYLLRNHISLS